MSLVGYVCLSLGVIGRLCLFTLSLGVIGRLCLFALPLVDSDRLCFVCSISWYR